jgi:hypothetical protein
LLGSPGLKLGAQSGAIIGPTVQRSSLALTARSSEVALLSLGVVTPALKRIVRSQAERIRDTHSSTFLNVVLLKSPACSCALSRPTSIAARSSS